MRITRHNTASVMAHLAVAMCLVSALPSPAHGQDCLPGGWLWDNPRPTGNQLLGVWAASNTCAFAVGDAGTIMFFNGSDWTQMDSGTTTVLGDIHGLSATDVYAVGAGGLVLHFDGDAWHPVTTGITGDLNDVWVASDGSIFVSGSDGIFHFDGSTWTQQTTVFYSSLWGTAPDTVYAVGPGIEFTPDISRYDGSTWQVEWTLGDQVTLTGLWASSGSDVYTVGNYYEADIGEYIGAVYHYDGSAWTRKPFGIGSGISDVYGLDPTDVTVCGTGIFRLDGSSWVKESGAVTRAVCLAPDGGAFAVGLAGAMLHRDGGTWVNDTDRVTSSDLTGAWANSANDAFAVGLGGTILHFDGTSWTRMKSGVTWDINAVWGSAPDDVFAVSSRAVGGDGNVLHYDGADWTVVADVPAGLNDVWGTGPNDVFTVGNYGMVFHYDGSSWTTAFDGTWYLYAVWAGAPDNVFVGGDLGVVMRYDGNAWTPVNIPLRLDVEGLWGTSDTDVYAAVPNLGVLHYDGTGWTNVLDQGPFDIWGRSSTDVYALTRDKLFHYDGATWERMTVPASLFAYDVVGTDCDLLTVGARGTILRYHAEVPVIHTVTIVDPPDPAADLVLAPGDSVCIAIATDPASGGAGIAIEVTGANRGSAATTTAADGTANWCYVPSVMGVDTLVVALAGDETAVADTLVLTLESPALPTATVLFQNYPNPFNPLTTIKFDLAVDGRTRLVIYTVDGTRVRTVLDEWMQAGTRRAAWDGRDDAGRRVASGVYLYRLQTPAVTLTRKMILLR